MSLSKEEKLEITNESLKGIIKELIYLFRDLMYEFEGQIPTEEIEKEIDQILDKEVTWHEC